MNTTLDFVSLPDVAMANLPAEWFNEKLFAGNELIHQYTSEHAVEIYARLNLADFMRQYHSVRQILHHHGYAESFFHAMEWICRMLEERGVISSCVEKDTVLYKQIKPLPEVNIEALKRSILKLDNRHLSMLRLIETASRAYIDVAKDLVRGEEALFGVGELQLWMDYFNNDNPLYALNNLITAHVAVDLVCDKKQFKILEFGAGAGSGAESLLNELARRNLLDRVDTYLVTEPNVFFKRKGKRLLQAKYPDVPVTTLEFDINHCWQDQLGSQTFDLIYSVNTLHVAYDIGFVLEQAKKCLNGALVAGECIRPSSGQPLYTEMIFQILDSFVNVRLDKQLRPNPGFLTSEQWKGWLLKHAFTDVAITPDIETIREYYQRFIVGVISGHYC